MDPFGTIPSPPWRAWPIWLLFSVKMTQPHPLLPINPTRFARDFRCVPCHLPDSPAPLYCHSSRPCRALGAPRSPLHGGAQQALSWGLEIKVPGYFEQFVSSHEIILAISRRASFRPPRFRGQKLARTIPRLLQPREQQNRISEVRCDTSVVHKSSHRPTSSSFTGHMDRDVIPLRSVDKTH